MCSAAGRQPTIVYSSERDPEMKRKRGGRSATIRLSQPGSQGSQGARARSPLQLVELRVRRANRRPCPSKKGKSACGEGGGDSRFPERAGCWLGCYNPANARG